MNVEDYKKVALIMALLKDKGYHWHGWEPNRYYFDKPGHPDEYITYFVTKDEVLYKDQRYPSKTFIRDYQLSELLGCAD